MTAAMAAERTRERVVLVVDDDPDILQTLALCLSTEGYGVVMASNGQEALEVLKQQKPACILLDLMMPVMDGWQFVTELSSAAGGRPLCSSSAPIARCRATQPGCTPMRISPSPSISTSCSARFRSSPAVRTAMDRRWPRRRRRRLDSAPRKRRPGFSAAPVAGDDPQGSSRGASRARSDPGEAIRRRVSVQRLIGGLDTDFRTRRDEEAIARLLPQADLVATEVRSHVLLAGVFREQRTKTDLRADQEREGVAGPWVGVAIDLRGPREVHSREQRVAIRHSSLRREQKQLGAVHPPQGIAVLHRK